MYSIVEGRDFALKGGKPGFRTSDGQWIEIDTKKFDKKELDRLTADYQRRRGATQIQKDIEAHNKAKAQQSAKPPAPKPPAATTTQPPATPAAQPPAQTRPPATTPAPRAQAPAPRPTTQPKIEKSPSGYAVGSVGGVKYERRAATSAELKAAREARERALKAAPKDIKGAELAAVKAGVGASKNPIKEETMNKEPYDLVLEYLLSQGHVESLDEALYVMMEMDSETIQSICEAKKPKKWIQKAIKHPGALSKELGVPEEENIPAGKLKKAAKAPGKLGKRARLAMTLKGLNKE